MTWTAVAAGGDEQFDLHWFVRLIRRPVAPLRHIDLAAGRRHAHDGRTDGTAPGQHSVTTGHDPP